MHIRDQNASSGMLKLTKLNLTKLPFVMDVLMFTTHQRCVIYTDNMRYGLAQFLRGSIIPRDTSSRYGSSFLLTNDEINCTVHQSCPWVQFLQHN